MRNARITGFRLAHDPKIPVETEKISESAQPFGREMSIVLSSLKLAAIAQLTVLSTGCVGALCAYYGIFEVAALKKMSKVGCKDAVGRHYSRGRMHVASCSSMRLTS